jgi:ATP-dependent Clp protease ATP-binding subunit ClpA
MLSVELEQTLNDAVKTARAHHFEYITVEHLLLALLPVLPPESEDETQPTLGFQRVIQRAILHVQGSGKKEVNGANVLVAIFSEAESFAVYFLSQQDIDRLDVVSYISHGVGRDEHLEFEALPSDESESAEAETRKTALDSYTVNLNEEARQGNTLSPKKE